MALHALITEDPRLVAEEVIVPPAPTAEIRYRDLTLDDLTGIFDRGYAAILRHVEPASPAFALYRWHTEERFDLTIGFQVVEPPDRAEEGDLVVQAGAWPAGDAMALSYLGNYAGLSEAWSRLMQAVAVAGREATGETLEVYVTEPTPDTDPATLRTDLFALLRPR